MLRDAYSSEYCSAPLVWRDGCSLNIVRAHTIPRSASLSAIARDGHVYMFDGEMESLIKSGGKLVVRLVGLKRASTFTGFCGKHDDAIFAPLEKIPFTGTQEQCFLLGYRGYAREAFTKKGQLQSLEIQRKSAKGRPQREQMAMQMFVDMQEPGIRAAIRDHEVLRPLMDEALVARDFSSVRAYVIEIDAPPPVMCSGSICPVQDFSGRELQNLADLARVAHVIHANCFFDGASGFFVLSWAADHDDICRSFTQTLDVIPDDQVAGALVRFMFEYFENICISPDWWESLSAGQREALAHRMQSSASPFILRSNQCLVDDNVEVKPWPVKSRTWIS